MKHIFYQEDFIVIAFDEQKNWIEVFWGNVYPTEEKLKNGCNKILEAADYHKVSKVLINYQQLKGTWTSLNEWVNKDWAPRIFKIGVLNIAHVNPKDSFSKFALNDMIKNANPDFIRAFDNEQEAKDWLAFI